jgi:hypothetical protein
VSIATSGEAIVNQNYRTTHQAFKQHTLKIKMDEVVQTIQYGLKMTDIVSLSDAPLIDNYIDPFVAASTLLVIRKTSEVLRGHKVFVRRVYARFPHAADYRYIGWVYNYDVDICMVCCAKFGFFESKHHCRVCGNIVCSQCSTGRVRFKEFREYGYVRLCDNCWYGQV